MGRLARNVRWLIANRRTVYGIIEEIKRIVDEWEQADREVAAEVTIEEK